MLGPSRQPVNSKGFTENVFFSLVYFTFYPPSVQIRTHIIYIYYTYLPLTPHPTMVRINKNLFHTNRPYKHIPRSACVLKERDCQCHYV